MNDDSDRTKELPYDCFGECRGCAYIEECDGKFPDKEEMEKIIGFLRTNRKKEVNKAKENK